MNHFLRAAGDVVLPRTCIVCGRRLNMDESHLCLNCLMDMPLTRFWEREHNPMADKFNEKIQRWVEAEKSGEAAGSGAAEIEVSCRRERYAYAAALFIYHSDANYRHILYQIKYQGNTYTGKYFGRMLGRKLAGSGREAEGGENRELPLEKRGMWSDVDMLIPVPLHWTRRWKRGYNQAEVIAGAVAEAMNVPMRNDILQRRRRTKTQTRLNIEEKAKNVNGAFAVNKAGMNSSWSDVRHIVIVDDVFTTGSTMTACFSALREVFPPSVRISALALGYLER